MTHLFLDTDVIMDYLTDRKPFSDDASGIFALMEKRVLKGHTTSLVFSNLYYLVRPQLGHRKTIDLLKELSVKLNILKVDESSVHEALDSKFADFEDALQYYSLIDYKRIDMIVTRNVKDYRHSTLPVMTPDTVVRTYG